LCTKITCATTLKLCCVMMITLHRKKMELSFAFAYTELGFWRFRLSWETTINYCDECCRRIYKTRKYICIETYRILIGAHILYIYIYYPAGCSSFSYFFSLSFNSLSTSDYYCFIIISESKRGVNGVHLNSGNWHIRVYPPKLITTIEMKQLILIFVLYG